MLKIVLVAGARPNFMKIAPICRVLDKKKDVSYYVVHTGQHYDENMSKVFFDQLEIPRPDINLNVGSDSHAMQTANIMIGFEKVLNDLKPDIVVVVGDVNSTIACSLVAAKLGVSVAHVEAGLRSNNWSMPEEINRVLTDRLSRWLFTSCEDSEANLLKEGIDQEKIFFVGNVMIDTLLKFKETFRSKNTHEKFGLEKKNYAVLTLHRPSNVDSEENLCSIFQALDEVQKDIRIVYPVHPRTGQRIDDFGLKQKIKDMKNFMMIEPLGYLDFLNLVDNSKMVLTDSGGIQEETTILDVPCITLRCETERPITVTEGSNVIVGRDMQKIISEVSKILNGEQKKGRIPRKWDGKASERIVEIIIESR